MFQRCLQFIFSLSLSISLAWYDFHILMCIKLILFPKRITSFVCVRVWWWCQEPMLKRVNGCDKRGHASKQEKTKKKKLKIKTTTKPTAKETRDSFVHCCVAVTHRHREWLQPHTQNDDYNSTYVLYITYTEHTTILAKQREYKVMIIDHVYIYILLHKNQPEKIWTERRQERKLWAFHRFTAGHETLFRTWKWERKNFIVWNKNVKLCVCIYLYMKKEAEQHERQRKRER